MTSSDEEKSSSDQLLDSEDEDLIVDSIDGEKREEDASLTTSVRKVDNNESSF